LVKFFEGGWIPLATAAIIYFLMDSWAEGYAETRAALERDTFPIASFIAQMADKTRVRGTAVYLTGRTDVVPVPLLHNLKHNKILHERIVLLHVENEQTPRIDRAARVETSRIDGEFYAVSVRYGFMEQPDIPRALLLESLTAPFQLNMAETSFFVGRLTIVPAGLSKWRRFRLRLYQLMHRNALSATEFFQIPPGRVVELGSQIEL
jgi:KUP system potassium uptake protein